MTNCGVFMTNIDFKQEELCENCGAFIDWSKCQDTVWRDPVKQEDGLICRCRECGYDNWYRLDGFNYIWRSSWRDGR